MAKQSATKRKPLAPQKAANKASANGTAAIQKTDKNVEPREVQSHVSESAIQIYLREIAMHKLLTPAEEIVLAGLIKKGDRAAEERMVNCNLRLVVKIARDYEGLGLSLEDMIEEGNIGLMKAVKRFDPNKGGKLSTYAAWWIKQRIRRGLANQSKTIRLPVHLVDKINRMQRVIHHFIEDFGREPSNEELAEELHTSVKKVCRMREAQIRPASLDAPVGDTDDSDLFGDNIPDVNAVSPYVHLEEKTIKAMLRDMIKHLPEREAEILNFRYGLDGEDERTLEEVGTKFKVTRERVRQIQNMALSRLRRAIIKLEKTVV